MAPASKPEAQRPSRSWEALTPSLSEWILDAISAMGFTKTTPVQASTIPLFMGNKDVVVEAVTGSGKTLAFLIPIIEKLLRLEAPLKKNHVGAIIISPTRELATQIHSVLVSLLKFHAPSAAFLEHQDDDSDIEMDDADKPAQQVFPSSTLKVVPQLLLGGAVTPAQDLSAFLKNSPNLLVGTPGRLLELLSSPHVHCPQSSFEVLVLDEADRLLDLGFKDDLQKILGRLPKQRRTGLFSASVSEAVDQLIRVGLRNPVRINVKVKGKDGTVATEQRTPASLQMTYLVTPPSQRLPAICSLLSSVTPQPQKVILYLATCYSVDYFQHILPTLLPMFTTVPLHGKQPDKSRRKNFARFVETMQPALLLTTDVAARGLDIPSVDVVLQLDPPSDPKTFIHRCGRAGRAGRKGLAITFLSPGREEGYVEFLRVRQTPIQPYSPAPSISSNDISSTVSKIRDIVKSDRALHDKAQRGFVSWVRSYSKHAAWSIFRITDLDWAELGTMWGLLKMPRMPELKKWEGDPSLGVSMDWDTYAYKDKVREKTRKEEMLQRAQEAAEGPKPGDAEKRKRKGKEREEAWSAKKEQLAQRDVRREKKKAKREFERKTTMTEEERKKDEELQSMIAKVRKQVREKEDLVEDEFDGFSD